jgi:hypothetical protein
LQLYDIKVVAEAPLKDEGLPPILNTTVLSKRTYFSTIVHKVQDREQIAI